MSQVYPDDLTDEEWSVVSPILENLPKANRGPEKKYSKRLMLNAIFYVCRTGCGWRHLPKEYPKWNTVYVQYKRWKDSGVFIKILSAIRELVRKKHGKSETPSAAIIDSQSVKTTEKGAFEVMTGTRKLKVGKDIS